MYTLRALRQIINQAITPWPYGVARPRSGQIIEKLIDKRALRHLILKSSRYGTKSRYAFRDVTMLKLATYLKPNAYLSHWSAADAHGLSREPAPTIYANKEQSPKTPPKGPLSQVAIDRAFTTKQRTSNYVFSLDGQSFTLLNGKYTGNYGIETIELDGRAIRVSNIPRTLIDITVRPSYAGGVAGVIGVFCAAKERLDLEVLLKTLQHLNHKYPFHQSLGYYPETAGFSAAELQPLRNLGIQFQFYLDYGMSNAVLNSDWNVYVPG